MLLLGLHGASRAQDWYGIATWNVSFPTDETQDFVDEISYRGFGLEFRKTVNPATTVGILTGWEVFHQRTEETLEFEGGAASGSQDRTINSFPIMLGAHRYFGERGSSRPYVGLSAGGFVLIQTLRIGVAEIEEDSWDWGIIPEAGVVVPMQYGAAFIANLRYHWSFTTQNLAEKDTDLTYWGIQVGFVWEQQ
jgi:hypothetical protein